MRLWKENGLTVWVILFVCFPPCVFSRWNCQSARGAEHTEVQAEATGRSDQNIAVKLDTGLPSDDVLRSHHLLLDGKVPREEPGSGSAFSPRRKRGASGSRGLIPVVTQTTSEEDIDEPPAAVSKSATSGAVVGHERQSTVDEGRVYHGCQRDEITDPRRLRMRRQASKQSNAVRETKTPGLALRQLAGPPSRPPSPPALMGAPRGSPSGTPPRSPFGTPPGSPFGTPPGSPFGTPPGSPFGTPPGSPFGTPPPTPPPRTLSLGLGPGGAHQPPSGPVQQVPDPPGDPARFLGAYLGGVGSAFRRRPGGPRAPLQGRGWWPGLLGLGLRLLRASEGRWDPWTTPDAQSFREQYEGGVERLIEILARINAENRARAGRQ